MDKTGTMLLQQRIDLRRAAMGTGITAHHAVLTDELLDAMAERFIDCRIHEWTGVSFERYIEFPAAYETCLERVKAGSAYRPKTTGAAMLPF